MLVVSAKEFCNTMARKLGKMQKFENFEDLSFHMNTLPN